MTVMEKLKFRTSLYELKEGRKMKPKTFAAMLSNMLYERRYDSKTQNCVKTAKVFGMKTFKVDLCHS
jgi:20S proteasome alpha/beta subunit